MPIFVIWILFGVGAALVARNKGASGCLWFLLGVLFGPFGLLFAFLISGKLCPHCKSRIHKEATKCPKCQQPL